MATIHSATQRNRQTLAEPSEIRAEPQISADLVARIGRGDTAAEAEMARRYERGLLYLLRRRTNDRDLALDLSQDTFRIAVEKLRAGPINEPERLAGYLRGVALNLVVGVERKNWRRATTVDSETVEAAADERRGPFDDVSSAQLGAAVRRLLDELRTPRDREILTRLYIDDEDRESICATLGIEPTHFNRVLYRAKQRFRELLAGTERRNGLRIIDGDLAPDTGKARKSGRS
jgi:RNA polymerase sigma-70 factor (ECF subfamily)